MAIAIDSNILIDLLGKPTAFTAHAVDTLCEIDNPADGSEFGNTKINRFSASGEKRL